MELNLKNLIKKNIQSETIQQNNSQYPAALILEMYNGLSKQNTILQDGVRYFENYFD